MTEHLQGKPNARERRYHRFFQVVEAVVAEIQAHQWADTEKSHRRLLDERMGYVLDASGNVKRRLMSVEPNLNRITAEREDE
ncbi:hypothetical protein [Limimaricola litoreus]|uniref:Uncharacterized protein n=1 Tax=Limimaricola litoreus TaxID=2955316 RepID=A0A9X2FX73_9RHOB|nr:hypothetical protein [Limimaricola litoreus]MCP1169223.1 hypothetical protein [Limimaricola litoreus]